MIWFVFLRDPSDVSSYDREVVCVGHAFSSSFKLLKCRRASMEC